MPSGFQPVQTPDPAAPVSYFPYFDRSYLAVAASLNGGNVLATFVHMLVQWMTDLGKVLPTQWCVPCLSFLFMCQTQPGSSTFLPSLGIRACSLFSSHLLSCYHLFFSEGAPSPLTLTSLLVLPCPLVTLLVTHHPFLMTADS